MLVSVSAVLLLTAVLGADPGVSPADAARAAMREALQQAAPMPSHAAALPQRPLLRGQMTDATRGKFDALVPRVIEAAAATPAPDAALSRILDLLEALGLGEEQDEVVSPRVDRRRADGSVKRLESEKLTEQSDLVLV